MNSMLCNLIKNLSQDQRDELRLVLKALEAPPPPRRAASLQHKKLYLVQDSTIRYSVSNIPKAAENEYCDESMLFLLANFPSSGAKFSAPTQCQTKNSDEVAIVNQSKGRPTLALFSDRRKCYVCAFGLGKPFNDVVRQLARQNGLKREAALYGDLSKRIRALLIAEARGFEKSRKRLCIYALDDYVPLVQQLDEQLLPGRRPRSVVKWLTEAQRYFNAQAAEENDNMRIANHCSKLFEGIDAEDIIAAEADGNGFLLAESGVAGESIAEKARDLAAALKLLAYQEGLEHRNRTIDECHAVMTAMRRVKQKGSAPKLPTKLLVKNSIKKDLLACVANYKTPTLTDMQRMIRENRTVPFDSPVLWSKQAKNDEERFRKKMGDHRSYLPLLPLWALRKEIFMEPIRSWRHFAELLLSEKASVKWIRFLVAAYAIAKIKSREAKVKVHQGEPTLLGHTLGPVIDLLLEQRAYLTDKRIKAHYMQLLLLLMLPRWFSCRQTMCLIVNIISRRDFKKRMRVPNMPAMNHVIDFIRTGDGPMDYRVRLAHGKKRGSGRSGGSGWGHAKDLDIEGEELAEYPRLLELMPEFFSAYALLTGHEVTAESTEPRWYITTYTPTIGARKGHLRLLQCHQFPHMFPAYEHGSRHYLSPTVNIDSAEEVWLEAEAAEVLPERFLGAKKWSAKMASEAISHLQKKKVRLLVDGVEHTTGLRTMPYPNKARKQSYCLFYGDNTTQSVVAEALKYLNRLFKEIVECGKVGEICLPKKVFGRDFRYRYKGKITEHLRVAARGGRIEFKFLGRYGSGVLELLACNALADQLKGCSRAVAWLKGQKQGILRAEDHDNERVVLEAYAAFKTDRLRQFAQLHNPSFRQIEVRDDYRSKVLERMASHPHLKPTEQMPDQFVEPDGAEGSLKQRCGSMCSLSIVEQNAQVRYLSFHWKIRELVARMGEDAVIAADDHFQLLQARLRDELRQTGKLWEQRWGSGGVLGRICERVKRSAEDCLSPRRKRMRPE